jgi:Holliday junction resolvasome RuvABC endonuclease subunit
METLEFIIYPDGRVKETVTGIVGSSCQEVTAAIEKQLGVVVDQKQTSDYYAQDKVQSATAIAQSNYSDW